MELFLELLVLFLNICLAAVVLVLSKLFSGSVFAVIPKYMLVLAASLLLHSGVDLLLAGPYEDFIYGLTAFIASLSYLILVYGVYAVLNEISKGGQRR